MPCRQMPLAPTSHGGWQCNLGALKMKLEGKWEHLLQECILQLEIELLENSFYNNVRKARPATVTFLNSY